MNVAVLGCGPSGLLAAHAARELGCAVTVMSRKEKSPILGGQYLHIEVPGITGKADSVTYVKVGDAEGYSNKVYGAPDVPCFRFPEGEYPAWSMTEAYDNLWGVWESLIQERDIEPDDMATLCDTYDAVLTTLPRYHMCYRHDHNFESQGIIVVQGASFMASAIENLVLYSGRDRDRWYRTSNLFGHETTEWSKASIDQGENVPMPVPFTEGGADVVHGIKPLRTDCDCHDEHDNLHQLGRFGVWKHGVLVSDAYEDAKAILQQTWTGWSS